MVCMACFTNAYFLETPTHFISIFQLWISPLRLLQSENLLSMEDAWFQLLITLVLSCTPKPSFSNWFACQMWHAHGLSRPKRVWWQEKIFRVYFTSPKLLPSVFNGFEILFWISRKKNCVNQLYIDINWKCIKFT